MPKVWNMDNKIKFDPADVKTWKIYDPGEWDYYAKKRLLTRWQVVAIFDKAATVYVGYYDSEEKAIDAVDALDAMKRDSDGYSFSNPFLASLADALDAMKRDELEEIEE